MSTTYQVQTVRSTGAGRQVYEQVPIAVGDQGDGRSQAALGVLSETVTVAQFTDGGAAVGTYQMAGSIPAGAIVLGVKLGPVVGFAGDTTAALTIGDGTDADRYNTGTPSVFATATVGVECGVPSGTKLLTAANRPTLTITGTADFTSIVTNAAGILTVAIYYVQA